MREQFTQLGKIGRALWEWSRRNPLQAFLFAAALAAVVYFFGFLPLYANHAQSIWTWAWMRFLPQYNQEHSKLIPLIVLCLLWYHRDDIRKAPKQGNNFGLIFLAIGIVSYVIGARALQPRIAIFGFPFLAFGSVLFLWGKQMARVLLFPIALLFFMTPLGAIEQTTFRLQFLIIDIVTALSRLFGMAVYPVGTSLYPVSGNWGFDIAEGCSGIRSLIAMVMVTAIYVHICEPKLWKKATILCFSVLFAIIGNAGRIFTIIVLAKLGFPKLAGGLYHEWSDWVFFPIALLSMYGFSKLLSVNFKILITRRRLKGKEAVVYDH
ncbi:MAG TPA: exosortase/archaeosortase family protein [Chthoniobacterales bacterium]|nr:exosortase/archaeosortase family protein [Chthoniobacterales bacterium]